MPKVGITNLSYYWGQMFVTLICIKHLLFLMGGREGPGNGAELGVVGAFEAHFYQIVPLVKNERR